jgi:hypothetical protein
VNFIPFMRIGKDSKKGVRAQQLNGSDYHFSRLSFWTYKKLSCQMTPKIFCTLTNDSIQTMTFH